MEHLEFQKFRPVFHVENSKKCEPKVQEMPNQSHFTYILQLLNKINSSLNLQVLELNKESNFKDNLVDEILLNRCACCYKHKKAYKHHETLGKYRCDRCRNRKIECLIQCIECYKKNKDKKDYFPQCSNCKVTREALLDAMMKSYKTVNPINQAVTFSTNDNIEYSSILDQWHHQSLLFLYIHYDIGTSW
ncbi:1927_t:CDS:2, partial [Gigaspora margarita]